MKNYFERAVRIVILSGVVILGACGDDPAPIKEAELTSGGGEWKLTALTIKAFGQSGDAYEECLEDDIFFFDDNGTFQHESGAAKCDPSEADIDEGTWEISGKQLIIEITGEDPQAVEILLLNSTTLKTRLSIDFFGVETTVTSTYTKQ